GSARRGHIEEALGQGVALAASPAPRQLLSSGKPQRVVSACWPLAGGAGNGQQSGAPAPRGPLPMAVGGRRHDQGLYLFHTIRANRRLPTLRTKGARSSRSIVAWVSVTF